MMRMRIGSVLALALLTAAPACAGSAPSADLRRTEAGKPEASPTRPPIPTPPPGTPGVSETFLAEFRAAFNAEAGNVRLVLLLSPT